MNSVATPWQDHRADLRRFVGGRVSDRHEAQYIMQDVFLKAHQSLHQLASTERAAAWLKPTVGHTAAFVSRAIGFAETHCAPSPPQPQRSIGTNARRLVIARVQQLLPQPAR
jgi:hypothetical protein